MSIIVDSPVLTQNYRSINTPASNHYRYSSCDQHNSNNSSQKQVCFNTTMKYQRKTLDKQRAHSQKKLTLTTQNNPLQSGSSQNIQQSPTYINHQQMNSYLNYAKQQNLKKQGKITLQKKSKYCSLKSSQVNLSSNVLNINNEAFLSTQKINGHINANENDNGFDNNPSKQRSKALLQNPKENISPYPNTYVKNNYAQLNSHFGSNNIANTGTNYNSSNYTFAQNIASTAPNSPMYAHNNNTSNNANLQLKNDKINNQQLRRYFQQKLTKQSSQTNKILFQQSMKIRQLQNKLIKNQEVLNQKNAKIQQLSKQLLNLSSFSRSQASKFNSNQSQSNSPIYKNFKNLESSSKYSLKQEESFSPQSKSFSFILQKISDIQKKCNILSKYFEQSNSSVNLRIDKLNNLVTNTLNHKFLSMKVNLNAFISKTQFRTNSYAKNIDFIIKKVQQLFRNNTTSVLVAQIKTIRQRLVETFKYQQKNSNFIEDMKNTMNTVNSSDVSRHSQRATQQSIQTHSQFKESSFWQNLQDVSFNTKQDEVSFGQDCFFYPGGNGNNNCSVISEGKQYFTSLESFSKLPQPVQSSTKIIQLCNKNYYSPFSKSVRTTTNNISSQNQKQPQKSYKTTILETIKQIANLRKYPIACYLDQTGKLRYKGSQSCIFDKRGNILKPAQYELKICIQNNWIILDDEMNQQN